jgi:hypothetical protein
MAYFHLYFQHRFYKSVMHITSTFHSLLMNFKLLLGGYRQCRHVHHLVETCLIPIVFIFRGLLLLCPKYGFNQRLPFGSYSVLFLLFTLVMCSSYSLFVLGKWLCVFSCLFYKCCVLDNQGIDIWMLIILSFVVIHSLMALFLKSAYLPDRYNGLALCYNKVSGLQVQYWRYMAFTVLTKGIVLATTI